MALAAFLFIVTCAAYLFGAVQEFACTVIASGFDPELLEIWSEAVQVLGVFSIACVTSRALQGPVLW